MSKVYKRLALILGVLILLVVGITLFLKFYLTGELLATWITPPLEHYLHRDVRLDDARIGFRGIRIEGLEIQKAGGSAPLLTSEELELRWKFKELVKGRIAIHTLVFSKPKINLIRYEDGSLNVADLLPQKNSSEPAAPSGVPLLISLLAMEDGHLTWLDRSREPQASLQINIVQSRVNDLSAFTPVPFHVEGEIVGENKGSFSTNGTFDLDKNNVKGDLKLQGVDLAILKPLFAVIEPLTVIQQGSLTLESSFSVEEYDRIKGKGSLNLSGLQIKWHEELSKTLEMEAGFQLDALISQQTLTIDALDLSLNGQKAKIQGLFTQWYQRPQLNFSLSSPQMKVDELLALLPKSASSASAAEINAEQVTPQKEPEAEKAEVGSVNESPSAPSSGVMVKKAVDGSQPVPDSAEELAAKAIGEPVVTAATLRTEPESTPIRPRPKPIPLDAQGEIHLDWLFYNKLVVSNVDCKIKLLGGKLQVEPLSASMYGGGLGASVKADVESLGPPFKCRIYSENVLLDEIVGAFWPTVNGSWSGNVNQISRASGIGSDLRSIKARTDLNINEAEFSDHPLLIELAELFQTEDLRQLRFSQVTARILTSRGVAHIKRLHLIGPILQAEGNGTAGLIDKKIDLRLHLQIQPQYVGKIASLRELVPKISNAQGFVRLPLTVKGTFDEPVYGLDEAWLAQLATELAEESAREPKVIVPPTPVLKDIDMILKGSDESKLAEEPKKPAE